MLFSIELLRKQVIQPCLSYLDIKVEHFDYLLCAIIQCTDYESNVYGVFNITHHQHWDLWDSFLVNNPALASKIRGLASQHRFLDDPDLELSLNIGYAVAVASFLMLREHINTPLAAQLLQTWIAIFPNINAEQLELTFTNFVTQSASKVA